MYSYNNRFYDPMQHGSKEIIITDIKPIEYNGFYIFERIKNEWHDIVKGNEIISQRVTIRSCKKYIDKL